MKQRGHGPAQGRNGRDVIPETAPDRLRRLKSVRFEGVVREDEK